jgi:hypothetical protein
MATVNDEQRRRLARRAYEWGRLCGGLRSLFFIVPMVAVATVFGAEPLRSLLLGSVLCALGVGFLWRGGAWAQGTFQGVTAGIVPMMLPLFTRSNMTCCVGGGCWSVCMVACVAGGVIAGGIVGYFLFTRGFRWQQMLATTVVASLSGALGCGVSGIAGIVGMVTAMALISTPVLVYTRLRAA